MHRDIPSRRSASPQPLPSAGGSSDKTAPRCDNRCNSPRARRQRSGGASRNRSDDSVTAGRHRGGDSRDTSSARDRFRMRGDGRSLPHCDSHESRECDSLAAFASPALPPPGLDLRSPVSRRRVGALPRGTSYSFRGCDRWRTTQLRAGLRGRACAESPVLRDSLAPAGTTRTPAIGRPARER
jgi:hypothetical protein